MFDDPYPDVIDKRRTTYVHPDARPARWITILLVISILGIPYLLFLVVQRAVVGGEYVFGHVWLTSDRLILSPTWLNRVGYRIDGEGSHTIEIPRDAITKIERRIATIILTTADRQYKFTPLKAREYEALLRSR